jgi:hypothetical protein
VRAARTARILVAALVAFLITAVGLLVPTAAQAAEIPGAITSVTTDKTTYGYNERIKLTFDWAVPDTATAGDTFTLPLPEELKAATLAKFSLLAPDGSVVADAAWAGKSVVFTLTDYVDSHDNVGGSGFLTVQWDHDFTPVTSQPVVLEFLGVAVEVVIGDKPAPSQPCTQNCPPPPTTPTARSLSKSGSWADGSYEGTRDQTGNINWSIALPGNETGFAGPIQVVDTPSTGSVVECATIAVSTQASLAGGTPRTPVDPARYTVDCAAGAFTIRLDTIAPSEFITVTYKGTITDQRAGAYANHVEVTIAGTTTVKDTKVKRTDAGGVGGGTQSVSVGDYVWLDSNKDGIQDAAEKGIPGVTLVLTGPNGAVTDLAGHAVGPTVTDADGHYTFGNLPVLQAGQHYTVTIDQAASSKALGTLKPTIPNAAGPASDSSTGSASSGDLLTNGARDATLDFGFVAVELPTLPLPGGEHATPPAPGQLAYTGSEIPFPGIGAAALLLVAGIASVLLARRAGSGRPAARHRL